MDTTERQIIDGTEALEAAIARARAAEREFSLYTQEKVDAIFKAAAIAANMARVPLAKMAVEETGMGVVEDKVIKNNYAAEYIYNAYKNTKTCGVIEEDPAYGIKKIAEPIGLQVPYRAQDPQRHHYLASPACKALHGSRGKDRTRRGNKSRRACRHHQLDRCSLP